MKKRRPGTGTIEIQPDGRARPRLPRSLGRGWLEICDTEAEAEALLAAALEDAVENPPEGRTVAAWVKEWLDAREATGFYRSMKRDRSRYRTHIEGTTLGNERIERVTPRDVRRWLASRACGPKTAYNALLLLRGAMRAAVEDDLIDSDPTVGVRLPKVARAGEEDRWTWLRMPEVVELLQAAEPGEQRCVFAAAVFLGCRRSELWALTWDAIDWDRGVVEVRQSVGERRKIQPTKNGKARTVPLLAPARAALEAWREIAPRSPRGYVWPALDGGPHHKDNDAGLWRLRRAAGASWRWFRFHDLRHTCASHLLQGTWAPELVDQPLRLEEVQQWLGHTTRVSTERYAHLEPGGLRARVVALPGPRVDQGGGGPSGDRTLDIRVKSAGFQHEIAGEIVGVPRSVVQRLVRARDELRDRVIARDPFAIQSALDMTDVADEIEAAARAEEDADVLEVAREDG